MSFVHLHTHSQYSLLDGLSKVKDLVARAKELQMPAVAVTDHGTLYGAVELFEECTKQGVKPIIGCEMYVAARTRHDKDSKLDADRFHIIVIAKNNVGYKNLLQLTSLSHLEGYYYKPRIDWELLQRYHEGLIILSGCVNSEVAKHIKNGNLAAAEETILRYRALFGEDYFLEIQPHTFDDQKKVNAAIVTFSDKLGVPLVATQDTHYLHSDDAEAHDVLLCLQTKAKITDPKRLSMLGEDFSFRSAKEMAEAMREYPRSALENTVRIAERVAWKLDLGTVTLPTYTVPGGQSPEAYLRELCEQGIARRYPARDGALDTTIRDRLTYELDVILKTGFAAYFLIVQDFVNWAKGQGIAVGPGRGSAAGSIVAYLTNITNIDPIGYDLVFERFLNPERIAMPDIDLDFSDTRRDEVLRYVEEKYGKDHVAQIVTFGTMAARAVVRDVGRVLGVPYAECDRLAKLIPLQMDLADAIEQIPELKEFATRDAEGQRLLAIAAKLEGVARHTSTHACGVLITPKPLAEYVPLQYASSSDTTVLSQYSLHPVEVLGLLKIDFLGLKNLSMIERTLAIVKAMQGKTIDLDTIPLDDPKAFALLQEGKTRGVFQLESEGMRRYLKQLKPTTIEDIIAMVSLYRPGPMELIPDYIAGKHGLKRVTYLHPKLEPILAKTYGVAVYQEQVLQIARDLAGFSLGEADILRKAVGKKIAKLLAEQKEKFVAGGVKNGLPSALAEKIFDFIEPFAGYGFNRSHGACYALIAYQTAYLKANEPAAFMAALLTADEGDVDRMAVLVDEARAMGIEVAPPDINASMEHFTVVDDNGRSMIRFGLVGVKNVGAGVAAEVIEERRVHGAFAGIENLLERLPKVAMNKKPLESLIQCGALDAFGDRGVLLANVEKMLAFARRGTIGPAPQASLFGVLPAPRLKLEDAPVALKADKLRWEKHLLGLYITEHPWEDWRKIIGERALPISNLAEQTPQSYVTVGGIIAFIHRIVTKAGAPMAFVTIEDTTGTTEVLVFPKTLEATRDSWVEERAVLVRGKFSDKDGEAKVLCDKVIVLDDAARERFTKENAESEGAAASALPAVYLRLPPTHTRELLNDVRKTLEQMPGSHRVIFVMPDGQHVTTPITIAWDDAVESAITALLGVDAARLGE